MKLLFLLISYLTCVHSAKILGVFHMPSYSHFTPGQTLMNALVDQGHDVSVIAPYDDKASKFKTIHLSGHLEKMVGMKKTLTWFHTSMFNNYFGAVARIHWIGAKTIDWTLNHPNIQNLLKSNETFDAIIIEKLTNEAFHGFCHHFNASCIIYSGLPPTYWLNPLMRNPENPAYMTQYHHITNIPMKFWARVVNTLMLGFQSFIFHTIAIPYNNYVMHQHFPNSPNLRDLLYETDLILLNTHLTYSEVGPLMPGMVEIGGFHLKQAGKLPEEFQNYLDKCNDGVILFSMGSIAASADLPPEKREIFINVFKKLKLKVLWKFEETIEGLPNNVHIAKWIPQKEVLAHPNVKLFITHGGLSSTIEAVYYGVPVVGIPLFGDQPANIRVLEGKGLGIKVDFWNLNEEDLLYAIQTVLNNSQYAKSAKKVSQLIKDHPMKPIDTAMYWIEHVIKYGGNHFKSRGVDLYWYQYMMIDVVAFLALVGGASLWISCFILRKIFCRKKCLKTDTKVSKDKKKK